MEKNLEKNPFCSAMAGVKTLHYVDIKNVATMTPTEDGWNVTLASGHYWSRIHFKNAKVNTESVGECYRHTVEVTVPAKGGVPVRDLMTLERGRYLVRVTDNNGVKWLMGDTTAPMRMTMKDNNDGSPEGETAYNIAFSALTAFPQMMMS